VSLFLILSAVTFSFLSMIVGFAVFQLTGNEIQTIVGFAVFQLTRNEI